MCSRRLARATPLMDKLVNEGRLPYARMLVVRKGHLVFDSSVSGKLGTPGDDDSVYRIFSMSKIFTSVAFCVLTEKYGVSLDEPLANYLGAKWAQQKVHVSGEGAAAVFEAARRPVTMRDCMVHTAGFVYGFPEMTGLEASCADKAMLEKGLRLPVDHASADAFAKNVGSLENWCDLLADVPLKFQPGTYHEYAMGHAVIGRVIEVASGMSLKDFMRKEVLDPLGCSETAGWYPRQKADLQPMYMHAAGLEQPARRDFTSALVDASSLEPATSLHGTVHVNDSFRDTGAAMFADAQMVATAPDCVRLAEVLTRRGRAADGAHLLSPATAELLLGNCLPDGQALAYNSWGRSQLGEGDMLSGPMVSALAGDGAFGYGLGGLTSLPGAVQRAGSVACQPGAYFWSGAAGTQLLADPGNDISIVFMTQCLMAINQPELGPFGLLNQSVYQSLLEK